MGKYETIVRLTDDQENYIRENAPTKLLADMANQLKLSKWKVGEFMRQNDIAPMVQLCPRKKPALNSELFNFNQYTNWLT